MKCRKVRTSGKGPPVSTELGFQSETNGRKPLVMTVGPTVLCETAEGLSLDTNMCFCKSRMLMDEYPNVREPNAHKIPSVL